MKPRKSRCASNYGQDEYGYFQETRLSPTVVIRWRWIPKSTDGRGGVWFAETPLTQAQYEELMGTNPSSDKGSDRPVEMISALDADAVAKAASERLGAQVELPGSEDWEYACRAGTEGEWYGELSEIAVYDCNETAPVRTKKPNAWGLYDMIGNVWEWMREDGS